MQNQTYPDPETATTKTLVTGGCGFLGSNITADALRRGENVTIIDALLRVGGEQNQAWLQSVADSETGTLTIGRFDLADKAAVDAFFLEHGPFDRIAHLAGQVAMTTSMADPHRDFLTNTVGTFHVLEAVRKICPDAPLVYSSTNKVYGEMPQVQLSEHPSRYVAPDYPNGFDEALPLDFSSPYGCSKGAADQYVRDWSRNFGLKTIVFRHSSIYGGRQFSTFDQGWIGWFCAQAVEQSEARKNGQTPTPFTIAGDGKQVRDVLHAEDLVRLYRQAWDKADGCAGSIFNIGGGMDNSLSLLELFSLLSELTENDLVYTPTEWRHSDQRVFVADLSAVKKALDWEPHVSSREGVIRQIAWVRQQRAERLGQVPIK